MIVLLLLLVDTVDYALLKSVAFLSGVAFFMLIWLISILLSEVSFSLTHSFLLSRFFARYLCEFIYSDSRSI
jgi:hypothetical protein